MQFNVTKYNEFITLCHPRQSILEYQNVTIETVSFLYFMNG